MKRLLPLVALPALLACSCARSAVPQRSNPAASPAAAISTTSTATVPLIQSDAETTQPAPKPPDGPVLTPEQVWDKLFALIESLHSEADLDKAHIERVIGLPLAKRPESNVSEYIAGDTTARWRYAFDLLTYHDKDVRMAVKIWLPDADDNGDSSTCTYPLQAMRDALEQRGFEGRDMTAAMDGGFEWEYGRGRLGVYVSYYSTGNRYYPGTGKFCVQDIEMLFDIPQEDLRHG